VVGQAKKRSAHKKPREARFFSGEQTSAKKTRKSSFCAPKLFFLPIFFSLIQISNSSKARQNLWTASFFRFVSMTWRLFNHVRMRAEQILPGMSNFAFCRAPVDKWPLVQKLSPRLLRRQDF
jgi:hypothetical protein